MGGRGPDPTSRRPPPPPGRDVGRTDAHPPARPDAQARGPRPLYRRAAPRPRAPVARRPAARPPARPTVRPDPSSGSFASSPVVPPDLAPLAVLVVYAAPAPPPAVESNQRRHAGGRRSARACPPTDPLCAPRRHPVPDWDLRGLTGACPSRDHPGLAARDLGGNPR